MINIDETPLETVMKAKDGPYVRARCDLDLTCVKLEYTTKVLTGLLIGIELNDPTLNGIIEGNLSHIKRVREETREWGERLANKEVK